MRKLRNLLMPVLLSAVILLMTGCGQKLESWAYDYEPTEETIAFYKNGQAVYKGEKYSYVKDDSFITLTYEAGEKKLRYEKNGDSLILYEKSTYKSVGERTEGSIVGTWSQDNGWSFVFTDAGEFAEENIFFGHYSIDSENSRIKLMYDDPVPDIYLYYTLSGDELTIDYPWPMTATKKS